MRLKYFVTITAFLLSILGNNVCNAADNSFYWFKEEIECDGYKIKVRSNCANEEASYAAVNGYCPEQEIIISHPDGKTYQQPLTVQHYWENKLIARKLACQKNSNGRSYFLIGFANGGNCDFCESVDLMDDKGRWLTRDGKHLEAMAARVGLKLNPWPSSSFTRFKNKTRDERP